MDIAGGQQVPATRCQPAVTSIGLALWAMPIAAGVEGDGAMPAAQTLIDMATECPGSASQNGVENFQMQPGEPIAATIKERVGCGAYDIGHLQRRPRHLCGRRGNEQRQGVERAGNRSEMPPGNMQVDGRLFEVTVPQQELNGAQ